MCQLVKGEGTISIYLLSLSIYLLGDQGYRKYILLITQPSQYRYAKLQYRYAVISGSPSTSTIYLSVSEPSRDQPVRVAFPPRLARQAVRVPLLSSQHLLHGRNSNVCSRLAWFQQQMVVQMVAQCILRTFEMLLWLCIKILDASSEIIQIRYFYIFSDFM